MKLGMATWRAGITLEYGNRWAHYTAVLSHIISQLRPGADLSRVVLPTFILEPRSMLERITKYAFELCLLGSRADPVAASCATPRCSCIFLPSTIPPSDLYPSLNST